MKKLLSITIISLFVITQLVAQDSITIAPANGLSADRPVLLFERNGVFGQPWGAAGNAWPQQLFWNNVAANNNHHLQEMKDAAAGVESNGCVPVLGCVAWGYEYTSATGGDSANLASFPDFSKEGGWKQWGEWMQDTNRVKYYSTNWRGVAEPGYITPLMPMEINDWPSEWVAPKNWVAPSNWTNDRPVSKISYGQWLGIRLAQLALKTGNRGMMCADYVIGLEWGDAIDYNKRVVDDFAAWAGITIPAGSISERADFIQLNHKSQWFDFKCVRFAEFYCSMGQNLLDNGKIPLLGGQTLGENRGSGNDFRIYTQGINGSMSLPGKYWFFNVELQADDLRPPHEYWVSAAKMGMLACREPDMQLGGQMNAFGGQGMFNRSLKIDNRDTIWGKKLLINQWLSVGWTHIAGRNGVVRRAPMSFMRSYWDAGKTPKEELNLILNHIPRHPFGPAVYYSVAIERSFEKGNGKYSNSWYMCTEKFTRELSPIKNATHQGYLRGLCNGYWVSDVGIDSLKPVDYPSAWIVYDSKHLPDAERTKLEAMAPIVDPEKKFSEAANALFPLGPVYIDQNKDQCLNCLAFVDQNESVIVMISNSMESVATARLMFNHVGDGTFECCGLYGCENTTLSISDNSGSIPISVPSRGTIVYEIPRLKWLGHENAASIPKIEKSKSNASIFPNPNNGMFTIELSDYNNANITIHDINGAIIFQEKGVQLGKHLLQVPGITKGVYILNVNETNKQSILKFVVK
jgi:hypothetical protein